VRSPLVLAVIAVDEHGLRLDTEAPERAVLAVEGEVRIADRELAPGRLAVIERGAAPVLSGSGRAVVLGGDPVGERHIWWNFVHSDRDRIEDAKRAWTEQRFPTVPGDHDPWVPLPG
jgi:redox-sensitive bicupin YhaK (pirin superfamily)